MAVTQTSIATRQRLRYLLDTVAGCGYPYGYSNGERSLLQPVPAAGRMPENKQSRLTRSAHVPATYMPVCPRR